MARNQEESQRTLPNKVEKFKGLLINKVNKAYIEKSETKGNQKGKNSGTNISRMEIFSWLLRNGMNKTDIDGVKAKVLVQHYLRLGWPWESPICPLTLKSPKELCPICPHLEKFLKNRRQKLQVRNLTTNCLEQQAN